MPAKSPKRRPSASATNIEFTVIVPCRLRSQRLPEKLLQDLGGKPLVVHALEKAGKAVGASPGNVIAAVDDPSLARPVAAAGFDVRMTADHPSGTSRAAQIAEESGFPEDRVCVVLQADEPFIRPQTIRLVATTLAEHPDAACATSVRGPVEGEYEDPHTVKVVVDRDRHALYFSRAPVPYNRRSPKCPPASAFIHHGIYAYRAGFLRSYPGLDPAPEEECEQLEQLRILWHGHRIAVATTNDPSFGIDTQEDLERARRTLEASRQ